MNFFFWMLLNLGVPIIGPIFTLALVSPTEIALSIFFTLAAAAFFAFLHVLLIWIFQIVQHLYWSSQGGNHEKILVVASLRGNLPTLFDVDHDHREP
ncbi:hypothetical protein VSR69_14265 [Paraburkholderia phytofirmans]|jgi:hypothetical protein|uniref:hypothetical protein n=1 Tax=Paraburkholderia sp. BL9I2N2 TaxID=1938809 RepID=UPI0010498654|nr:hypothetical protein [Paraburkholderia sp. BL9I2N2]